VIKIQIRCIDQNIKQVRVSGHAGGRAGEDVVCAAVSAVTQTALTGLLHYGAEQVKWEMKKGILYIEIKDADTDKRLDFSVILNTMYLGLRQIEREHPDEVHIRLIS